MPSGGQTTGCVGSLAAVDRGEDLPPAGVDDTDPEATGGGRMIPGGRGQGCGRWHAHEWQVPRLGKCTRGADADTQTR